MKLEPGSPEAYCSCTVPVSWSGTATAGKHLKKKKKNQNLKEPGGKFPGLQLYSIGSVRDGSNVAIFARPVHIRMDLKQTPAVTTLNDNEIEVRPFSVATSPRRSELLDFDIFEVEIVDVQCCFRFFSDSSFLKSILFYVS